MMGVTRRVSRDERLDRVPVHERKVVIGRVFGVRGEVAEGLPSLRVRHSLQGRRHVEANHR